MGVRNFLKQQELHSYGRMIIYTAISRHLGDYILAIDLTPREIVFNKPHPSMLLYLKDGTTQKMLILFLFYMRSSETSSSDKHN
jgi:hypothetical protein